MNNILSLGQDKKKKKKNEGESQTNTTLVVATNLHSKGHKKYSPLRVDTEKYIVRLHDLETAIQGQS